MNKVFLSCGLGDFFALLSWLSPKEKKAVETIYWATRARELCQPFVPNFLPNVKEQIIVRDDFGTYKEWQKKEKDYCVTWIHQVEDLIDTSGILDYGASVILEAVMKGKRTKHKKLKFPIIHSFTPSTTDKYYVIHPFSDNYLTWRRDFSEKDWDNVISKLEQEDKMGVILNKTTEELIPKYVQEHDLIQDYTNRFGMRQSIEIIRNAVGFIGSASSLSVIAYQLLEETQIIIKGSIPFVAKGRLFYYPTIPSENFFVDGETWKQ